jgi:hypothetical protein
MSTNGRNWLANSNTGTAYSNDAMKWTLSAGSPAGLSGVIIGSTVSVAYTTTTFYTSTNFGVTWSGSSALPATISNPRSKFLNGIFFLFGQTGSLFTSVNGTTWTNVAPALFAGVAINDICWSGTQYVLVGAGGRVATTPDLVTFTTRTAATGMTGNNLICIATSGTFYMVGSTAGTLMTSSDAITWATNNAGLSSDFAAIGYRAGVWIAIDIFQNTVRSTNNGSLWSAVLQGVDKFTVTLPFCGFIGPNVRFWAMSASMPAGVFTLDTTGPGYSPMSDRGTGISGDGSGQMSIFSDFQRAASFGASGGYIRGAVSDWAVLNATFALNNPIGQQISSWTNDSSTTLNAFSSFGGTWTVAFGIWAVQSIVYFTATPSGAGTSMSYYVGLGMNTWATGSSGNALRWAENLTEQYYSVASNTLPPRMVVQSPWVFVLYRPGMTAPQLILPGGNATLTVTTLYTMTRIDMTTATLSACSRVTAMYSRRLA